MLPAFIRKLNGPLLVFLFLATLGLLLDDLLLLLDEHLSPELNASREVIVHPLLTKLVNPLLLQDLLN